MRVIVSGCGAIAGHRRQLLLAGYMTLLLTSATSVGCRNASLPNATTAAPQTAPTAATRDTLGAAEATPADTGWVPTPAGLFHRSCVHETPEGSFVRDDTVYRRDGTSYAIPACRFKARASFATLYGPSRLATPSGPLPVSPDFVAHVLNGGHESVKSPPVGPYSQVDLVVAVAPDTNANAVVIVDQKTPVYRRHGTEPVIPVSADSIALGDELEVWHNGRERAGLFDSPPDPPLYYARRIVIRR